MLSARTGRLLCKSCRTRNVLRPVTSVVSRQNSSRAHARGKFIASRLTSRQLHTTCRLRASEDHNRVEEASRSETSEFVRETREVCGEWLPHGYLTDEEYDVYKVLYGPAKFVEDEDIGDFFYELEELDRLDPVRLNALLEENDSDYELDQEDGSAEGVESAADGELGGQQSAHTLLRQSNDGSLEEVEYDREEALSPETARLVNEELQFEEKPQPLSRRAREAIESLKEQGKLDSAGNAVETSPDEYGFEEEDIEDHPTDEDRLVAEQYLDGLDEESASQIANARTHPHTLEGRSGTNPSTLFMPRDTFTDPISEVLATASNKHLTDMARQTFGGTKLPDSVATPRNRGEFKQRAVALDAAQNKMKAMEANTYLAAMMPGLYASITSILVEVRRRLGSKWLEDLMSQPKGPRILDIGGGGAAVLAWRDILRAEWSRMHPDGPTEQTPLGEATVVSGTYELTSRVSKLLDNTTFIPRQPHFSAIRDLPGAREYDPDARKQYDIVIAPHTLWGLDEDYLRKNQVQNFWSLLNPEGGVLVLLEKGLPRGFEMVAGARELLLSHHIQSLGSDSKPLTDDSNHVKKEPGMIIAPCTNHGICPMYTIPGEMAGRKDHCHFQQRYERPVFLKRILHDAARSHEDIRFSYIAVQRGRDQRQERDISQNEEATLAALEGYEDLDKVPEPLSLPRVILPPLKRRKHVTFDLCTPSGQLERWTMPASKSKQGYRDARKSQWGDLWALGAKTRVIRPSRSGKPKKDRRAKQKTIEVDAANKDNDGFLKEVIEKPARRKTKDGRKGRIWRKERKISEDELD